MLEGDANTPYAGMFLVSKAQHDDFHGNGHFPLNMDSMFFRLHVSFFLGGSLYCVLFLTLPDPGTGVPHL